MNTELMTLLNFNGQDLEANRAGKLSENQRDLLRSQWRRSLLLGFVGLLLVALIATTFLFFGSQQESPILSFVGWGVTILNAVMMGVFLRHWLRLNSDLRGDNVTSLCGETTFTVRMVSKRVALYLVRVENDQGFVDTEVSRDLFEALRRHKGAYCLYRTSYTGKLLSIESL